jgi:D-aminoacyl-tRNA deacylase
MRAVVQRVLGARVVVESDTVAQIDAGLLVLVGIAEGDGEEETNRLAGKVARLRIFEGDDGKFDRSVLDVEGEVLAVSQFTLIADSRRQRGTRPDFSKAAQRDVAEPIYDRFCEALRELGLHVETGVFGASMQVELVNDGPVTLILDVEP